ncbi:hypothetical protein HK096_009996, partial [Nowakowskiella sp. JEL0078]
AGGLSYNLSIQNAFRGDSIYISSWEPNFIKLITFALREKIVKKIFVEINGTFSELSDLSLVNGGILEDILDVETTISNLSSMENTLFYGNRLMKGIVKNLQTSMGEISLGNICNLNTTTVEIEINKTIVCQQFSAGILTKGTHPTLLWFLASAVDLNKNLDSWSRTELALNINVTVEQFQNLLQVDMEFLQLPLEIISNDFEI